MSKAYTINAKKTPEFTERAAVISECYAVVKRAKKPVTVAEVRAKVEAHFGEPCTVRHSLMRLEKGGFVTSKVIKKAKAELLE